MMVQNSLSRFAACGAADYRFLKAQIDTASQEGRSYEFGNCLLLPGCRPQQATVSFWRDRTGYLMSVFPPVTYSGRNTAALCLFRTSRQGFANFEALQSFLRDLAQDGIPLAAAAEPAALTEPEAIVLPEPRSSALSDYSALASALGQTVLGQENAVTATAFKLYAHINKKNPLRPLSLIFHGPTGVGKSELGKQIAPVLNRFLGENTYQFVWTELNTFTQGHSVYRLVGAPPGYVGYDDKPVLEAVLQNPNTVFMFDELEKAHPEVLKTLMSVLDEGRCAARRELADHARELNFRRCIFLFTTNTDLSGKRGPTKSPSFSSPALSATPDAVALADRIFAANERGRRALADSGVLREIAGRCSGYIEFSALDSRAKVLIIARQIAALGNEYGLEVAYIAPDIIQAILDRAVTEAFSVRSHTSIIEGYLTEFFLCHAEDYPGLPVRLEGTVEALRLVPMAPPPSAGTRRRGA